MSESRVVAGLLQDKNPGRIDFEHRQETVLVNGL
jgi:hypothetical protein